MSVRHNASALIALADDAIPAALGKVLIESISIDAFVSQGIVSVRNAKSCSIFGTKLGFGWPLYRTIKPGVCELVSTSTVMLVWHSDKVKLSDGFRGSWMPCF